MKQITVRDVPPELAKALYKEIQRRGASLNQTILDLLKQSLGISREASFDNGLSKWAGTWSQSDLKAFQKNTAIFDIIDDGLWK